MKERTGSKELIKSIMIGVTIGSLIGCIVTIPLNYFLTYYRDKQIHEELSEEFARIDRELTIKQLSELKGRIEEIRSLSYKGISEEVLRQELDDCVALSDSYSEDFFLELPTDNDLGKIYEELIAQIEEKIYSIESGTGGE